MRHLLRRPLATVPAVLLAALMGLLLLFANPATASADSGVSAAAAALKKTSVYVDPAMTSRFSDAQAAALSKKIADADKPIYILVVPNSADYPGATVAKDVRAEVGIAGVYGIWRGDVFKGFADPRVLSPSAVQLMSGAAARSNPGDINGTLNNFVDQAVRQAKGHAAGSGGISVAAIAVPAGLVALVGGFAFVLVRRNKKRKELQRQQELAQLRKVVDEDLTAFGEELSRLDFNPRAPYADEAQRGDYTRALDSYERAKRLMDAAKQPADVKGVTEALQDGRFSLATLAARRENRPLPERRPPCFFDPRHGPSVSDAQWAPAGGALRTVPVCSSDAARLASGMEPDIRTVPTQYGPQPYWNAGPAYSPWAGGYYSSFGSGLLPGLLVGTMLGEMLAPEPAWGAPGYESGGFDGGGYDGGRFEGGDYTGADFNQSDFGGFGDFGGGDSGGGDSNFGGF